VATSADFNLAIDRCGHNRGVPTDGPQEGSVEYRRQIALDRLHIVETIRRASETIDEVNRVVRASLTRRDARRVLTEPPFDLPSTGPSTSSTCPSISKRPSVKRD